MQCSGSIEYINSIINLSKLCDLQNMSQTFLHEILHGIVKDRAIKLDGDEEDVIDSIATGLHALLIDNPKNVCVMLYGSVNIMTVMH